MSCPFVCIATFPERPWYILRENHEEIRELPTMGHQVSLSLQPRRTPGIAKVRTVVRPCASGSRSPGTRHVSSWEEEGGPPT